MSKSGSSTSTVSAKDQRYVRDGFMQSRLHFYVRRFASGASTFRDADTVNIGSSDGGSDGAGVASGVECPAIGSSAKSC